MATSPGRLPPNATPRQQAEARVHLAQAAVEYAREELGKAVQRLADAQEALVDILATENEMDRDLGGGPERVPPQEAKEKPPQDQGEK